MKALTLIIRPRRTPPALGCWKHLYSNLTVPFPEDVLQVRKLMTSLLRCAHQCDCAAQLHPFTTCIPKHTCGPMELGSSRYEIAEHYFYSSSARKDKDTEVMSDTLR